ncbi:MAG: hypothetical protein SWX82_22060 [Cyanobacteriota bacterium]|nr:hypothetical protein [Cyanobacteriota bacterium]
MKKEEGRRKKAEGRRQKAEGRRQKGKLLMDIDRPLRVYKPQAILSTPINGKVLYQFLKVTLYLGKTSVIN